MKNNRRTFSHAITLLIVSSVLLCMLLLAGCSVEEQTGGEKNEPTSQNTHSASDTQNEAETPKETAPFDSGDTVSFIRGMGCEDETCTLSKHHHDCPPNCDDYNHYHYCELDCMIQSHNHQINIKPVESDKAA